MEEVSAFGATRTQNRNVRASNHSHNSTHCTVPLAISSIWGAGWYARGVVYVRLRFLVTPHPRQLPRYALMAVAVSKCRCVALIVGEWPYYAACPSTIKPKFSRITSSVYKSYLKNFLYPP